MQYKNLKRVLDTYIRESNSTYTDPDGGDNGIMSGSIARFAIEDPEVFLRINSFLKLFCTERHHDAKHALVLLRTKLNTLGLDFPYDGRRPLSPKEIFHMTQFGGRQGMNDKGEYFTDCGITNRTDGKSLDLHVDISPLNAGEDNSGPYYIHAKLVFGANMKITREELPPEKSSVPNSFKK